MFYDEIIMTKGVGGKTIEQAMSQLSNMTAGVPPISKAEFEQRLSKLQSLIKQSGAKAIYLHAGTNLYYFTGLKWSPSERMVAAIVPAEGEICYIAPKFELDTLRDYWLFEAPIHAWEEHESPYELFAKVLTDSGVSGGTILIDESTPFFIVDGLQQAHPNCSFASGQPQTVACRSIKSKAEIEIIRRAHEMTLEVHKAAATILKPGISTTEVEEFIDKAHRKVGASAGSYFCIVLFGVATSFPHGVKDPQTLQENDWVLFDTGCHLHGYNSDITRSFCYGEPTDRYRTAWETEKRAQIAAFEAAQLGQPCEAADLAARRSLEADGFGPGYKLPGLPHRTGHGCGLDIHEAPNLVTGEKSPLEVGMVFSDEPMLVIPDEFGIRLEDHFYLAEDGPHWFTEPCPSVDDPFGIES